MRMVAEMKKKPEPPSDDDRVYEMQVRICKAFAHPSRLRMLEPKLNWRPVIVVLLSGLSRLMREISRDSG